MDTWERCKRTAELYDDTSGIALAMTMVLVRRNSADNEVSNAAWWQSICYGSRRDQLSFPLHFPGPYLPAVDFTVPNEYFTRVA